MRSVAEGGCAAYAGGAAAGMAAEPGTSEVRPQHRFDAGRLERLLCRRLAGFPQQPEGALAVRQYR